MGIFTDFFDNVKTLDVGNGDGHVAEDKADHRELLSFQDKVGDGDYSADFDAKNEVQSIAVFDGAVSGGNYTLKVELKNGETFTTANIAHNADAATIEAAIDTAADGVVTDWTDGDISVSGGDLTSAAVVLTFDGDSVAGANHVLTVITDVDLTGGGTVGEVSTTTEGQTKRTAWAVMDAIGLTSGTPPTQGTSAAVTAAVNRGTYPNMPSQDVIRLLAKEAAIEDDNEDVATEIIKAFGLS